MIRNLDDQLAALVRDWDNEAPAISIEEAKARVRAHASVEAGSHTFGDGDDRLVLVSIGDERPRRRWRTIAMIGVAAAMLLVGLVVLVRHGPADEQPFRPGIDTVAQPTPSALPSTSESASTTSTTTPDTIPPPAVVPTYTDPTT